MMIDQMRAVADDAARQAAVGESGFLLPRTSVGGCRPFNQKGKIMNIPAHVLAQANPLARATMQQMTGRSSHPAPASMSTRGQRPVHTAKELAEASEKTKARMRALCGAEPADNPAASGSNQHATTQEQATASAVARMKARLQTGNEED